MAPFLASTGFLEFTPVSLSVVAVFSAAAIALLGGSFRVAMKSRQLEVKLETEGLIKAVSGWLAVKRKGSNKTITLPPHYTAKAAQELLDLLAQK